jgi:hypothetical protein
MSELETGAPAGPNKIVYILLGVIVVLLIGVVAAIAMQGPAKTATPTATAPTAPATTPPAGMTTATEETFDPATATRVPEGETPEQFVEAYFKGLVDKNYESAYNRLPAAKKASQSLQSFSDQIAGYGITGYEMGATTTEGEDTKVTCSAVTSSGNFEYIWTFTQVDGAWVVKARVLGGMG